MANQHNPKVVFLRVTDNQTKLRRITTTAQLHFEKGERVLILVPNDKAASFIDDLLWSSPKESFLPHSYALNDCDEQIAITHGDENLNKATIAINLCRESIKNPERFERIYELYDQSEEAKEKLSKQKILDYQKLGCHLI